MLQGICIQVAQSFESAIGLVLERAGVRRPSRFEDEVVRLYDQFRSPLLRYVFSLGVLPADGEEIVQEVFLCLFRHLREGKSRANLRGWRFRVGHNQALKNRQRRTRAPEAIPDGFEQHRDPSPDPEQQASVNQRQARLISVLRALPEQDQCCLSLRAEGFRYREIAEILGISLGSVANSLERSLARLNRADGGDIHAQPR
jgi:RNA polymerase sigma-70 factor (ECF subfamily)